MSEASCPCEPVLSDSPAASRVDATTVPAAPSTATTVPAAPSTTVPAAESTATTVPAAASTAAPVVTAIPVAAALQAVSRPVTTASPTPCTVRSAGASNGWVGAARSTSARRAATSAHADGSVAEERSV